MAMTEPERAGTPAYSRMASACRTCQFVTAVVYTSLDTEAVVRLSLCTTTAACLSHASRPG